MQSVFTSDYYLVHLDEDRVVHFKRTATAWPSLDTAKRETDACVTAIRAALGPDARGPGLLMDFRDARSRNDEAFEDTMSNYRDAMRENFDRVAVVVKSAVGRLQIDRLNQGLSNAPHVFDDPERAKAWLTLHR